MGDYLCVFICIYVYIYSNRRLLMLIFNKCVELGYTELFW